MLEFVYFVLGIGAYLFVESVKNFKFESKLHKEFKQRIKHKINITI